MTRPDTTGFKQSQQAGFQVRLSNFEGPFDLLLQLIFAHRLDVTEVALHQVTDDFIAYTKADRPPARTRRDDHIPGRRGDAAGPQGGPAAARGRGARRGGPRAARGARPAVRAAAAVPGVQACRGDVRRTRGRGAAQLSAVGGAGGALRRSCCPRSCSASTPRAFAQIAAAAFTPRPVPTVGIEHLHEVSVSVPEQVGNLMALLESRGIGQWASFSRAGGRLRGADRDRRPVPGAARAVSGAGGSIRPIRTAWCAPDFVDRRTADQRTPGNRGRGGSRRRR